MTMTNHISKILIFFSCFIVQTVFAHGIHETNDEQSSAERPKLFWEYFITQLEAKASIHIDEQGGYRYIESDGLADHATGRFPNSNNPNAISAQDYNFRVPLKPKKRSSATPVVRNSFGVAINGVPFDAATAEYWNNDRSSDWNIEALTGNMNLGLDSNNAHVQPNGAYHYHGIPTGIVNKHDYKSKPLLIGYAADGFPIYAHYGYKDSDDSNSGMKELKSSYRIKSGTRPSGPGGRYDGTYTKDYEYAEGKGNLDQCNGRTGITPEYPEGTYYYVVTNQFPFIPRCLMGSADSSFSKGPGSGQGNRQGNNQGNQHGGMQERRGPPGGGGPSGRGGPPQEAISACSGKRDGASCSFTTPRGRISGSCRSIQSSIACVPSRR